MSSSSRNRSPPSTRTFSRPSSKRVRTWHTCTRSHVADSLIVGVHEPELGLVLDALADQLLDRSSKMQRELLGGEKDETERKQSELIHHARVRA